jgi:2-polyprenyl-3-methyl-5-hydroxy-6-metoxy-1,4-benzoquinol methylase
VDKHIGAFDVPILDVGCGSGDYVLPYAKKLRDQNQRIVGVEVDKDIVDKLSYKLVEHKQPNASVVTSLDDVQMDDLHDIICIEVIEHMPLDDAKALVVKLAQRNFRKLIISTPNVTFNQFYTSMCGPFRHDDHKFEFDRQEFQSFIAECLAEVGGNFNVRDFGVGDQVADISMAQACIITKE